MKKKKEKKKKQLLLSLLSFLALSSPPIVVHYSHCRLWMSRLSQLVVVECLVVVADVEIISDSCAAFAEFDGLDRTCYDFSYFALFIYVFSLFLEVSHGAAALTHFSLTYIAATLLTHSTAVVLTHSIAILIALPHWCSIYSGQSCRLFFC